MNALSPTLPRVTKSWLLITIVIVGGVFIALGARATIATGQGANFDAVLNEPARVADNAADISWSSGEPLLREIEPQTMDGIEFAWTRALSAVANASVDGDLDGVDVWFSGPAQDQVHDLVATGAVLDSESWVSHEIAPTFYSIDGQILVTTIERTAAHDDNSARGVEPGTDTVRAVFILRDGNWRVEHLVRVGVGS